MVFLCGRPGCGRESSATLQIDAPSETISLVDPRVSRDGVPLCPHHADATTPPVGWTMNDLRSVNRTLAPVRSIGPKTGEIVTARPEPRPKGNPWFQSSRTGIQTELVEAELDEAEEPVEDPLSFEVSRNLRTMPVTADGESDDAAPDGDGDAEAEAEAAEATADGEAQPQRSAKNKKKGKKNKAPASRPTRRREVLDDDVDEDDKFPWHHHFADDEPQELQAKSPLLSRAFRSSVG